MPFSSSCSKSRLRAVQRMSRLQNKRTTRRKWYTRYVDRCRSSIRLRTVLWTGHHFSNGTIGNRFDTPVWATSEITTHSGGRTSVPPYDADVPPGKYEQANGERGDWRRCCREGGQCLGRVGRSCRCVQGLDECDRTGFIGRSSCWRLKIP